MRDLVLKMSVTLDGFVGGPDGGIDWLFPGLSDDAITWTLDAISGASLHVMGSRTFRDMMAWWPGSTEPFAPPMNDIPKAVFTRCGDLGAARTTVALNDAAAQGFGRAAGVAAENLASWENAEVMGGDLAADVARLKQRPGSYMIAHGGASFARSLIAAAVVDEYRLLVHPVALGRGLPLFAEARQPLKLHLMDERRFSSGTVALTYRPVLLSSPGV